MDRKDKKRAEEGYYGKATYFIFNNRGKVLLLFWLTLNAWFFLLLFYREWSDSNTEVAIWRLMRQDEEGSESLNLMGDLEWISSGWLTDTIELKNFASGDYFFELEFFDGSVTHFFNSDVFTIEHSTTISNDLLFFLFIILVGLCTVVGYYLLRHRLPFTNQVKSIKPLESKRQKEQRLSKLEPLFYGKEKPNVDDIEIKRR